MTDLIARLRAAGSHIGVSVWLRVLVQEAADALAAAQAKLNQNRCNSGHETLPLILWDCPECHSETKRKLEAALRDAQRWQFIVQHDEFHTDQFGNVCVSSHKSDDYQMRKFDESVDALSAQVKP